MIEKFFRYKPAWPDRIFYITATTDKRRLRMMKIARNQHHFVDSFQSEENHALNAIADENE